MESVLLLTVVISFLASFLTMPFWVKKAKQIGLVWTDMNKFQPKEKIAGSGGLITLFSFSLGVLFYIAIRTFYFKNIGIKTEKVFALLLVIFIASFVGFVDDLLGWQKGGLSMKSRLFLVSLAAIPLMVINAGVSNILGLEVGILFPLVIIPIGIIGATTTFNFLAGYNGLEAGQGIIILSALSIVTFITGNKWLSVVTLCMVASLIGFYIFNKNPAEVFPGDIMTYAIGATIAGTAILGNIEKISLFFFIPYILEALLKIRGGVKNIYNFGIPQKDNSLELRYKKIYSLTHLSLYLLKKVKKKVYENDVTYSLYLFQIVIIILGLIFLL